MEALGGGVGKVTEAPGLGESVAGFPRIRLYLGSCGVLIGFYRNYVELYRVMQGFGQGLGQGLGRNQWYVGTDAYIYIYLYLNPKP